MIQGKCFYHLLYSRVTCFDFFFFNYWFALVSSAVVGSKLVREFQNMSRGLPFFNQNGGWLLKSVVKTEKLSHDLPTRQNHKCAKDLHLVLHPLPRLLIKLQISLTDRSGRFYLDLKFPRGKLQMG